jgi:hypothetical protein
MMSQPEPSTQEVLAGLVERVTYHNAENGFCVLRAKARGHRDAVTVVGHAAAIAAGEWIVSRGAPYAPLQRTGGHRVSSPELTTRRLIARANEATRNYPPYGHR